MDQSKQVTTNLLVSNPTMYLYSRYIGMVVLEVHYQSILLLYSTGKKH